MMNDQEDIIYKAQVMHSILKALDAGEECGEVDCPKCHSSIDYFYSEETGGISLRCKTEDCMTYIANSAID